MILCHQSRFQKQTVVYLNGNQDQRSPSQNIFAKKKPLKCHFQASTMEIPRLIAFQQYSIIVSNKQRSYVFDIQEISLL